MNPPERLSGVNYVDEGKVRRIAASMKARGWDGRPLLVEEDLHRGLTAWTGSHRIEAAKVAGLREIPCRVIIHDEVLAAFARLPDPVGYFSLRGALSSPSNRGGRLDRARLEGLRRLGGLDEAAAMLEEEIASEPG